MRAAVLGDGFTLARTVDTRPVHHAQRAARAAARAIGVSRWTVRSWAEIGRGDKSKVAPAAPATACATAAMLGCSFGSSACSDVMRTAGMPHGTMRSKYRRSVETLSAKPCHVTQSRACTPIDAILRSSIHTPVYAAFLAPR